MTARLLFLRRRLSMPRFFLHVDNGKEVILDEEGSVKPDYPAARREAIDGDQRRALPGPLRLRLADAADPLRALADGLWLVPRVGAALSVPDHPRCDADAGS
jgi:hypothetical protein